MKKGFDFIAKQEGSASILSEIEKETNFSFPPVFKDFVARFGISSDNLVIETERDELRGFEFPVEAVVYPLQDGDSSYLYFSEFRDLEAIGEDIKLLSQDSVWEEMGLIAIDYSTVGEKVCLGVRGEKRDQIWRLNEDSIPENRYTFLAEDIVGFVEGFISKRAYL